MARSARGRRQLSSNLRSAPYPLPPCSHQFVKEMYGKTKSPSDVIKKDWEDATCSVCMEFPHNAVLLLCSSHDKGCRPYMCGTGHRYSNCLDQFKKAYTKSEKENTDLGNPSRPTGEKSEVTELACPLCRGQVKGWTVVEPAREYLNKKKRSCMQDKCSFSGSYKELRKHVKAEHRSAKPWQVDPVLEQKWRRLEHERDREDVMSTIRSSMPGAMVMGDYVIENGGDYDSDDEEADYAENGGHRGRSRVDDDWFNFLFLLQAFGNSRGNRHDAEEADYAENGGHRGRSRVDDDWFNFLFLLQAFGNSRGNRHDAEGAGFASRLRRSRRSLRVFGEDWGGQSQHSPGLSLFSRPGEAEGSEDGRGVIIRQGIGQAAAQRIVRRRRRRRSESRPEAGLT